MNIAHTNAIVCTQECQALSLETSSSIPTERNEYKGKAMHRGRIVL
jgi:hypothetical protein